MGACVVLYSRTDLLPLAIGLMIGMGIANLFFVIPSQTLFQQRVPRDMMARVVSIRFSLVLGTMTLATGVSGILATIFGVGERDRRVRPAGLPGGRCRAVHPGRTRRVMAGSVHWRPRRACAQRSTTAE